MRFSFESDVMEVRDLSGESFGTKYFPPEHQMGNCKQESEMQENVGRRVGGL